MDVRRRVRRLAWFARRPDHWLHASVRVARRFHARRDGADFRAAGRRWAEERSVSPDTVAGAIGFEGESIPQPKTLVGEERYRAAERRGSRCPVDMGGPAELGLLYVCCEAIGAMRVLETGVAAGWSSFVILASLANRKGSELISIDMPYPEMDNEEWVGVVVPQELRSGWRLIRRPDRNGLLDALAVRPEGSFDLCHYDSDKSYYGRRWAYPLLWDALRAGGLFISDDIEDNTAFKEFVEERDAHHFIVESQGKFVGFCLKPQEPAGPKG